MGTVKYPLMDKKAKCDIYLQWNIMQPYKGKKLTYAITQMNPGDSK